MGIRNAYVIKAVVTKNQLHAILENKDNDCISAKLLTGYRTAYYHEEINKTPCITVEGLKGNMDLIGDKSILTATGSIGSYVGWDDFLNAIVPNVEEFAFSFTTEEGEGLVGAISDGMTLTTRGELQLPLPDFSVQIWDGSFVEILIPTGFRSKAEYQPIKIKPLQIGHNDKKLYYYSTNKEYLDLIETDFLPRKKPNIADYKDTLYFKGTLNPAVDMVPVGIDKEEIIAFANGPSYAVDDCLYKLIKESSDKSLSELDRIATGNMKCLVEERDLDGLIKAIIVMCLNERCEQIFKTRGNVLSKWYLTECKYIGKRLLYKAKLILE